MARFLEELDDELPHSLAVVVDSIEYPEDNDSGEAYDGKAHVIVSIYVERDSQKGIIIGKQGKALKKVATKPARRWNISSRKPFIWRPL